MGPCNSTQNKKEDIIYNDNYDYEWVNHELGTERKIDLIKTTDYKLKANFFEFVLDDLKKKKLLICKYLFFSGDGKIKALVPILGTDEKVLFDGLMSKNGIFKMIKKFKKLDSTIITTYDGSLEQKIKEGIIIEGFYSQQIQQNNSNGFLATETNKTILNKKEFVIEFTKNKFKVEYSEKYAKDFVLYLDIEENENVIFYLGGISRDDKGISIWRGVADENEHNKIILVQQYIEDHKIYDSEGAKKIIYEGKYDRIKKIIEGNITTKDLEIPVKFKISALNSLGAQKKRF